MLLPLIQESYEERKGILEYRQMTIKLNGENDFHVNSKRIYSLLCILNLKLYVVENEKLIKNPHLKL